MDFIFFFQFYSSPNKEATVLTAYYITQPEHINQECGLCFVFRRGIRGRLLLWPHDPGFGLFYTVFVMTGARFCIFRDKPADACGRLVCSFYKNKAPLCAFAFLAAIHQAATGCTAERHNHNKWPIQGRPPATCCRATLSIHHSLANLSPLNDGSKVPTPRNVL